MMRFAISRLTEGGKEIVGHVEVADAPFTIEGNDCQAEAFRMLRRARRAAVNGGLVRDADTFIIYPETRDAQRIREHGKEPPQRRHDRMNDDAAPRLALWHHAFPEGDRRAAETLTRIELGK